MIVALCIVLPFSFFIIGVIVGSLWMKAALEATINDYKRYEEYWYQQTTFWHNKEKEWRDAFENKMLEDTKKESKI